MREGRNVRITADRDRLGHTDRMYRSRSSTDVQLATVSQGICDSMRQVFGMQDIQLTSVALRGGVCGQQSPKRVGQVRRRRRRLVETF